MNKKQQQALDLIQVALNALEDQPAHAEDEDLITRLEEAGISSDDARRLVALLPVAFGRAILQQRGMAYFRDDVLVGHPGGKNSTIQLSDQPIYVAGVRVGVVSLHHGTPTPKALDMLARRSVELRLLLGGADSSGRIEAAPSTAICLYGYEEGVFAKPPWWRRKIF